MEDIIVIKYEHGTMNLYPSKFFPCTKGDMKKVLDCVDMDIDPSRADRVLNEIMTALKELGPMIEAEIRENRTDFDRVYQDFTDTKKAITTKTSASGIPLRGENLKSAKRQVIAYKEELERLRSRYSKLKTKQRLLQRDIEYMTERYGGSWE